MDISTILARLSGVELPTELDLIIRNQAHDRLLDTLSRCLVDPKYTDVLSYSCYELLPDLCSRFGQDHSRPLDVLSAYARILPLAPYLAEHAHASLRRLELSTNLSGREDQYLLSLLRLLHFDHRHFSDLVDVNEIEALATHNEVTVRHLAARVFCLFFHAAEAATKAIVKKWQGGVVPRGAWEQQQINYRYLPLWEAQRFKALKRNLRRITESTASSHGPVMVDHFYGGAILVGNVLLPSSKRQPDTAVVNIPNVVETPTIVANMQNLAVALKDSAPILVSGQAGSGKTSLIRHTSQLLGRLENMITLHLNEQSDAKTLIGIYTSGDEPGTFVWRPGVLTKAVREGRWILIEDLDRAPNEVLSVLLPLIERQELSLPGREQTIQASLGFRIIATVRTMENHNGREHDPSSSLLGIRHWNRVRFSSMPNSELVSVVRSQFPNCVAHADTMLSVFQELQSLQFKAKQGMRGVISVRPISVRELLRWVSRVSRIMSGRSTLSREDEDAIFLSAIDCFAGSLSAAHAREIYAACIAQHCRIDPQRRDYLIHDRVPEHRVDAGTLVIGHHRFSRISKSKPNTGRSGIYSINKHSASQLERIAAALQEKEPVLLVGETGTGKTTSIQYMAGLLGKRVVPFNLSQQSEIGDLLGGFKPVNTRTIIIPMQDEFEHLFKSSFAPRIISKNQSFLELLNKCISKEQWLRVCKCWHKALGMVEDMRRTSPPATPATDGHPSKKRRMESELSEDLRSRWDRFQASVLDVEARLKSTSESAMAFSFVEGSVVKAARNGDWILLDEINLASPDTLEALADLFDKSPSIMLSDSGSTERVYAHDDFRVFAAMNPATDVGKKDLPLGIRSRFTELFVDSPDRDLHSLQQIVQAYLGPNEVALSEAVSRLHQEIISLSEKGVLVDGAGHKAHFSLRTLTRVLTFARSVLNQCSLRRALHEGFSMSYLTLLDAASELRLSKVIDNGLCGKKIQGIKELRHAMQRPQAVQDAKLIQMGRYWLLKGTESIKDQEHYIITDFVQRNLDKLTRAAMTRQFPILLQGPTSSGKTSMVEYLANKTGHKFIRINNHEHTDLQEYLGSYVSRNDGQLVFQEGLLVRALREGHWIVLDELNLAPTEVLEALNRLLDDNRELLIPETQETIRPHPNFMLFATQNPAGVYGGRKALSRAFRNRFLELHFDDIPIDELETIIQRRTSIAPSWSHLIVRVYKELSMLRQESKVFEQKGFATLRDLFRWAFRPADVKQDLANNGYMILGERCRKPEERQEVKEVIEKVLSSPGPKVAIDAEALYNKIAGEPLSKGVVWTKAMKRLYSLVRAAITKNEPVLLIGETGCGKTTVCQVIAEALGQKLHIVNAHENMETGDLIGAYRPRRNRAAVEAALIELLQSFPNEDVNNALQTGSNGAPDSPIEAKVAGQQGSPLLAALKVIDSIDDTQVNGHIDHLTEIRRLRNELNMLFEWADGSVVQAMRRGDQFLLDEISLADDSVLERLNSVLESQRSLLLAEKGSEDSFVTATEGFQFFATMNPGGDYGKKELSPALRNRFTEIWVPPLSDKEDLVQVLEARLKRSAFAQKMITFAQWFHMRYNTSASSSVHIRDLLAWSDFMNSFDDRIRGDSLFCHGACLVYIDGLGANPAGMVAVDQSSVLEERQACMDALADVLHMTKDEQKQALENVDHDGSMKWEFAFLTAVIGSVDIDVVIQVSRTVQENATRVARAMRLSKPILLEGDPGVGKTTLVSKIAKLAGKRLTRINLSEQTDLMDLFGSDAPVEGEGLASFAWRDAPFLRAMKKGEWVLLDEMNLASQSILEGLNACLDHRGEVYIPELDQTFYKHAGFRLFAAQNPHHQGGGRKGLPASFVNRFTVVYANPLGRTDFAVICATTIPSYGPTINEEVVNAMQEFAVTFGPGTKPVEGAPFEFNLRDAQRWLTLHGAQEDLLAVATDMDFVSTVISQRLRTEDDRFKVARIWNAKRSDAQVQRWVRLQHGRHLHNASEDLYQVGLAVLPRSRVGSALATRLFEAYDIRPHLLTLESMMLCISQKWPILLVGPSGCGKTTAVEHLARTIGQDICTFSMNADIDSMDLVGGYEQHDKSRQIHHFARKVMKYLRTLVIENAISSASSTPLIEAMDIAQSLLSTQDPSIQIYADLLASIRKSLQSLGNSGISSIALRRKCFQNLLDDGESLKPHIEYDSNRFEWVDSKLVKAMQQGQWLILDNANLCNSAALDRLNGLLEPERTLIINEHTDAEGNPTVVNAHENFRIILTMDPKHGELSRALRNRCLEHYMMPKPSQAADLAIPSKESSLGGFDEAVIHFEDSTMHRISLIGSLSMVNDHGISAYADITVDHLASFDLGGGELIQEIRDASLFTLDEDRIEALQQSMRTIPTEPSKLVSESDVSAKRLTDLQTLNPGNNTWLALTACGPDIRRGDQLQGVAMVLFDLYKAGREISEALSGIEAANIPSIRTSRMHSVSDVTRAVLREALVTFTSRLHLMDEVIRMTDDQRNLRKIARLIHDVQNMLWIILAKASDSRTTDAVLTALAECCRTLISRYTDLSDDERMTLAINIFEAPVITLDGTHADLRVRTMEGLWSLLRPSTPTGSEQLALLDRLRTTAERFDDSCFSVDLPLQDVVDVRIAYAKAMAVVAKTGQGEDQVMSLIDRAWQSHHHNELESDISDERRIVPHLRSDFERVAQAFDLAKASNPTSHDPKAERLLHSVYFLAQRSTVSAFELDAGSQGSDGGVSNHVLRLMSSFAGSNTKDHVDAASMSNFGSGLIQRLRDIILVPVSNLTMLQQELKTIGHAVALNSTCIEIDLNKNLIWAFKDVHDSFLRTLGRIDHPILNNISRMQHSNWFGADVGPNHGMGDLSTADKDVANVIAMMNESSAFCGTGAINGWEPSIHEIGIAWIGFAVSAIWLYIPEHSFDPALKGHLFHEIYHKQVERLDNEIVQLQRFEGVFTGATTTERIERMYAIREDVDRSHVPERLVFRSGTADWDGLLNIFEAVRIIIEGFVDYACEDVSLLANIAKEKQTLSNLRKLRDRLENHFTELRDLAEPLWLLLNCFEIGFACLTLATTQQAYTSKCELGVYHIPLAGSDKEDFVSWFDIWRNEPSDQECSHHFELRYLNVFRSLLPRTFQRRAGNENVAAVIESAYRQWKSALGKGQDDAAARSSMYRYRGGDEIEQDEDEDEMRRLFPDEDAGTDPQLGIRSKESDLQDLAPKLFDSLTGIGKLDRDPSEAVLEILDDIGSSDWPKKLKESPQPDLLPVVLRQLDRHTGNITDYRTPSRYNIYTDPNPAQVQLLSGVVKKTWFRFQSIRNSWPDHAVPIDILQTCKELFQLPFSSPLTKIITKLEKLHGHVHEWQTIASREFSATSQYDAITDMIVSWRQLELSTWSRMLDDEVEKCEQGAKAWFFIAYESVVPALHHDVCWEPNDNTDGGPREEGQPREAQTNGYVSELIKTLQSFFQSTGLGEFSTRLSIVSTLQEHVAKQGLPRGNNMALRTSTALYHFIAYIRHFEDPVREAIAQGRKAVDTEMKNVIQMASWRDRNIHALRQSAKTSHRKLFKVIRKFRTLLAQPVGPIIQAGAFAQTIIMSLPPPDQHQHMKSRQVASSTDEGADLRMQLPTRYQNIDVTLRVMDELSQTPSNLLDGASDISTWWTDVQETASTLRKATPAVKADDNKATAQHLKGRKRMLFADVLKALRMMGFKSNLTADVLEGQDSFPKVIEALPSLRPLHADLNAGNQLKAADGIDHATLALHQMMHWIPAVRESSRSHSDDLTGAEIGRSVALIESMLHQILSCRSRYAEAQADLLDLSEGLQYLHTLGSHKGISRSTPSGQQKVLEAEDAVNALKGMLEAATSIVQSQFRLAEEDGSPQIDRLRQMIGRLERTDEDRSPQLPTKLYSQTLISHYSADTQLLRETAINIKNLVRENPALKCVLGQLDSWTKIPPHEDQSNPDEPDMTLMQFREKAQAMADDVLAATETIRKSLENMPKSDQEAAWLLSSEKYLSLAVDKMQIGVIGDQLFELFNNLHRLSDTDLHLAVALLLRLSPIFEKYEHVCQGLHRRRLRLHTAICQMAANLAKMYVGLARDGFCSPKEKDTDATDDKDAKVEAGTGLGDGEGGEDISKDIGDDEDLSELAQEKNADRDGEELEDEKDAVDMADAELEGEFGEEKGKADGEEEGEDGEEGEAVDSEAGSVSDLGDNALDEKMWDDSGKQDAEKDQEADKAEGTKDEEMAAAGEECSKKDEESKEEDGEGSVEEEQVGADEEEVGERQEAERTDPTTQEQENLDLPDDIDMDGQKKDEDDVDGDLDMLEDEKDAIEDLEPGQAEDEVPGDEPETQDAAEIQDAPESAEDELDTEMKEAGEDAEEGREAEDPDNILQDNRQDDSTAAEQIAPSEARGTGLDEEQPQDEDDAEAEAGAADRPSGKDNKDDDESRAAGSQGQRGQASDEDQPANNDDDDEATAIREQFKQLGDALDKWYRQQRQIQDAQQREEQESDRPTHDTDMRDVEFEHLPDEKTEADAQALGAAREDEATAIDETAGTAVNEEERQDQFPAEEKPTEDVKDENAEMRDVPRSDLEAERNTLEERDQAKAFVGENHDQEADQQNSPSPSSDHDAADEDQDVQDLPERPHFAAIQPSPDLAISHEEALKIWRSHESRTRTLSLQLQEQLRLILHPTQSSKLRGDFRTGKRLNIKRIIPYIASNYKRDKIWLRRSVPSKRQFQIAFAVDDSQSMRTAGVGDLAFDTLALVSSALRMLEVGELAVMGFGEEISTPVQLGDVFGPDKGAEVVRTLRFEQTGTNVTGLLSSAAEMFEDAKGRRRGSGVGVWQLMLILGDGIFNDPEGVRRLERQMREQGVMVVFVVVDVVSGEGKQSIMELPRVEFDVKGGPPKITRYMETFPFRYYLIVRDVGELPGVLASALRQWFAEVADTG